MLLLETVIQKHQTSVCKRNELLHGITGPALAIKEKGFLYSHNPNFSSSLRYPLPTLLYVHCPGIMTSFLLPQSTLISLSRSNVLISALAKARIVQINTDS